ncbi:MULTISPECIES: acetylglutamate kinase [Spirosoma]|uniref:Acetylglutamate kinase n=1 Tax=Spirosoma liriopis TaxID=2937440 RepID=A0ABT0HLF1_9BACT|nr:MULTISPECIES: acetylglutamate kinase [Spirosoma]MCK8492996.1 acetylglutamate kinase [Spirosoma liriopis]UHG92396.1 acetylglutamate kinase [Spirosoma oryzicola]
MNTLTVIKIGGNVIDDPAALTRFLTAFAGLPSAKVLIHGGGKVATQVADKLGIQTTMVEGRRITDQPMLDVVTMVYGGLVNKQIVAKLQALDVNAIGLTGADAGTVLAKKRPVNDIDYGMVGDIDEVNSGQIQFFLHQDLTPVFAPLTYSEAGELLNTNADTMASAIAVDMVKHNTVTLVYCFEKKGVLADPNDDNSVINELTPSIYAEHKAAGTINKGMIPKLDNAFKALTNGVSKVVICHADEVAAAVQQGAGTTLRLD